MTQNLLAAWPWLMHASVVGMDSARRGEDVCNPVAWPCTVVTWLVLSCPPSPLRFATASGWKRAFCPWLDMGIRFNSKNNLYLPDKPCSQVPNSLCLGQNPPDTLKGEGCSLAALVVHQPRAATYPASTSSPGQPRWVLS